VQSILRKSAGSEPADAERALQAEGWFRKGAAMLEERDYPKAIEALGMAAHLDPKQGEYLCHLGYALFLSNPRNTLVGREAMEQMAKGIKLSPERPLSYVFLGRALKATDDVENARRMFRRALKLDPDFHPARQELRALGLDGGKKGRRGWQL
jgi:cytochrome c-type biogenesis protein CcmH/NrfG